MKVSLKKINQLALYMLIFISLFSNWFLSILPDMLKNIFWVSVFISIFFLDIKNKKFKFNNNELLIYFSFISIFLLNVSINGFGMSALQNLFFFLLPLTCLMFVINLYHIQTAVFDKLLNLKFLFLLNLYFVLNTIIIIFQNINTGFLMSSNYVDGYYPDYVTGFMGPGGTHTLILFDILLTILNLKYLKKSKNKNKLMFSIYIFITIILMTYTSSLNDNTAFLVLFPSVILTWTAYYYKLNVKYIINFFLIVIVAIFLLNTIYSLNESFKYLVDVRLMSKIEGYIFGNNTYSDSNTDWGDERLIVFKYVIDNLNGLYFGKGFNSNIETNTFSINYNIGMSDISRITYHSGLVFYVYYCLTITYMLSTLFKKHKKSVFFILLTIIIIFTIYSSISRSMHNATLIALIFILLRKKEV